MPVVFHVIGAVIAVRPHLGDLKAHELRGQIAVLKDKIGVVALHHTGVDEHGDIGAHAVLHQDPVHGEAVDQVRLYSQILPVIVNKDFLHRLVFKALLRAHAGDVDSLLEKGRLDLPLGAAGRGLLGLGDLIARGPVIDRRGKDAQQQQNHRGASTRALLQPGPVDQQEGREGKENRKDRKVTAFRAVAEKDRVDRHGHQETQPAAVPIQRQEQTEAGIDHEVRAVGVAVFVDDPAAVAKALSVGHVPGVCQARQDQEQKRQHGTDPHAAKGVPPCLFLPDQEQEANRENRHLHHAGKIADVRNGADIAVLPGIENMQQAESARRQQEAEEGLLPPGGEEHRRRQRHQQHQPYDSGGRGGFIPRPVGQHVQTGLRRKQQHQPETGPPDPILGFRQHLHPPLPRMEMAPSLRRRHLTCTLTGAP